MTGIVDYGVGNLSSLENSLLAIGEKAVISRDPEVLRNTDRLILPGVGAFPDAARMLSDTGMAEFVKEQAREGKDILGVCLGMQLLFDKSYEYGVTEGLGLLQGEVISFEGRIPEDLKIPHMGWNALDIRRNNRILKYLEDGEYMYFVHSYFVSNCDKRIVCTTEYGTDFPSVVSDGNIFGCQFHPEKSGEKGLLILKGFCEG